MLLSCPSCARQYRVDPSKLWDKDHRYERQLKCYGCGFLWFINEPDPSKDSLSENPPLELFEKKKIFSHPLRPVPPKPVPISSFMNRYKLDWIILFLALVLVGLIFYSERSYFFDDDTTLVAPTESPKVEDLTIDALQYNIEPQSTNSSSVPKPKITVQGEIVNHSKTYKQVPDLNVYVWGTCPEKCLLLTWQHKMFHKQLMPGERFPFKTTADVQTPENIVSTQVMFNG